MDYKIIYSSDDTVLAHNVNKALKEGYEPIGGITIKGGCKGGIAMQAVFKNSSLNSNRMREIRQAYRDVFFHRSIGILIATVLTIMYEFSDQPIDNKLIVWLAAAVIVCSTLCKMAASYCSYKSRLNQYRRRGY